MNMRPGGPRPRYGGALGLCLTLASLPATAQLITGQTLLSYQGAAYGGNHLAVDGGAIYTDNVQRTANGANQTLLTVGLSGDTSHEGARFDYHLASSLALLKYVGGAYPTGPSGYLDGTALFKFVPGFFSWIVRETYSQVQIDPYLPVTPHNLENINYVTTGPRFTLRPTLRTSVTLDALYSYLTSSSSSPQYINLDNHRYGGDLTIDRAFSQTSSLYLKGHYEKVDFKDQTNNNNFSLGDAKAGYKLTDGRTVLDISGGYSQLRVYDVPITVESPSGSRESLETQEFHSPIWAFNLSRLITPSQRLALTASQLFTDAATAFRLGFNQAVPLTAPQRIANNQPFKQRQFGLNWHFQASRTGLDLTLSESRERYVTTTANDRNAKLATAFFSRQLSPVLIWEIGASWERSEQAGTQPANVALQSSTLITALTDLRWQVGERLNLRFIYAHSRQSSTYSDNQVGITASWAVIGAQAATGGALPALAPVSPLSTQSPYQ
jgi:hypothetical protein